MIQTGHLNQLTHYITSKYGIVITREQAEQLKSYTQERMDYLHYQYFDDYFKWLSFKADETEWEQYVSLITNNETYFFREPNHYKILETRILPELLETKSKDQKIRIWSCGSSSGEEIYSVVILLINKYGFETVKNHFEIIASDLDQAILQKARLGRYGRNSFRVREHDSIKTHFLQDDEGKWTLNHDIRQLVTFFRYNVCDDMKDIAELKKPVDVLFFRNVSIYFGPETLQQVHNRLQNKIKRQGYLLVASCETMLHDLGKLKLREYSGSFLFHKTTHTEIRNTSEPAPIHFERSPIAGHPVKDETVDYDSLLKRIREIMKDRKDHVPDHDPSQKEREFQIINQPENRQNAFQLAIERVKEDLFEESIQFLTQIKEPNNNELLVLIYSYLSIGLTEKALPVIKQLKTQQEFSPVPYLLEGMALKQLNRLMDAISAFRNAIYSDINYSVPHFHMASVLQSLGKDSQAKKEFELVLKKTERSKKDYFPFDKPDISVEYIEYASEKILATYSDKQSVRG